VRQLPPEWRPADPPDWEAWDWVDWVVPAVFYGVLAGIFTALCVAAPLLR
jgi:hypothetical protein